MSKPRIHLSSFSFEIGTHIPLQSSLEKTVRFSLDNDMNAFQVFIGAPISFYPRKKFSDEDILKAKDLITRFNIKAFTHLPYIYNLSWATDRLVEKNVFSNLEFELNQMFSAGFKGCVIHPGSCPEHDEGIDTIKENLTLLLPSINKGAKLLLENAAGEKNKLGSTLEDLAEMLTVEKGVKEEDCKLGICLDSAHIQGAGLYDLSKIEEIDKMFQDVKDILGLEKLKLFHLNDSLVCFCSKKDRHACLCQGEIWKGKENVLRYLINSLAFYKIPAVVETVVEDMKSVHTICK